MSIRFTLVNVRVPREMLRGRNRELGGHRKELGVDLLIGVNASTATNVTTHNKVQSQGISIGT